MLKNKFFIFVLIVFGLLIFLRGVVLASITDGTIDGAYKYAWGENIGWLNFGTTEGNVHITDSVLAGYAWGENIGWININPTYGGVTNDGEGNLSGYAWSENTGWINFNPTYGGVTINSSGEFFGYAWGENVGWIVFNCATTNSCSSVDYKVKTDWRPQSARPACNNATDDDGDGKTDYPNDPGCSSLDDNDETDPTVPGGGGMPVQWHNPPTPPAEGFGILINSGTEYTNSPVVTLNLLGGPNTERMAISNFSDFRNAGQEKYQTSKTWDLCKGKDTCPEAEYIVYAKFYAPWGKSSEVVSNSIIYKKGVAAPGKFLFEINLRQGMRNDDVYQLQVILKKKDYLTVEPTSYFGPLTLQAVRAYQKANGLPNTGFMGPMTRELLNAAEQTPTPVVKPPIEKPTAEIPVNYRFTTNLEYNQRGDDVRYLQTFLKAQGPDIYPEGIVSGWFGPLTKAAVVRFQEKYTSDILAPWGLINGTGFVGKTTRNKINEILGR